MSQHTTSPDPYQGGENTDFRRVLLAGRRVDFQQRLSMVSSFWGGLQRTNGGSYLRAATSAAGREVSFADAGSPAARPMLMFGSNNYLGLTTHPYVVERVRQAVDQYGAGVGGPPLLNGYTRLHAELEERLAAFKGAEAAILFHSGYSANIGLLSSILTKSDVMLYDTYSHASFIDGLKMSRAEQYAFAHNDMGELERLLQAHQDVKGDLFVGVEGVYSMDGDLAPLDEVVRLCDTYGAVCIVDDAHGTGVTGPGGHGTCEHFGASRDLDIVMGTFSKTFGVVGGFIAGSRALIDYLRLVSRAYMFSASLPPSVVAAVLAGLDLIDEEPAIVTRLWDNIHYASGRLREIGFDVEPRSAILPLMVPEDMPIRPAAAQFVEAGIFINSIEYPVVPLNQQRFRISMMATHTRRDIDRLVEVVDAVWTAHGYDQRARRTGGAQATAA